MKPRKPQTPLLNQRVPNAVRPLALFVDFDNAWFGLQGAGIKGATPKTIAWGILELARQVGAIAVARAYSSEPRRIPGMRETFARQGYEVVAAENPGKNTDMQMAFDGQEVLYSRPEIDTYIL